MANGAITIRGVATEFDNVWFFTVSGGTYNLLGFTHALDEPDGNPFGGVTDGTFTFTTSLPTGSYMSSSRARRRCRRRSLACW